jgi:hypothetical protein
MTALHVQYTVRPRNVGRAGSGNAALSRHLPAGIFEPSTSMILESTWVYIKSRHCYECEYSLDCVNSTTIDGSEGTEGCLEPFCSSSGWIIQMKLAVSAAYPTRFLTFEAWLCVSPAQGIDARSFYNGVVDARRLANHPGASCDSCLILLGL